MMIKYNDGGMLFFLKHNDEKDRLPLINFHQKISSFQKRNK